MVLCGLQKKNMLSGLPDESLLLLRLVQTGLAINVISCRAWRDATCANAQAFYLWY